MLMLEYNEIPQFHTYFILRTAVLQFPGKLT